MWALLTLALKVASLATLFALLAIAPALAAKTRAQYLVCAATRPWQIAPDEREIDNLSKAVFEATEGSAGTLLKLHSLPAPTAISASPANMSTSSVPLSAVPRSAESLLIPALPADLKVTVLALRIEDNAAYVASLRAERAAESAGQSSGAEPKELAAVAH